MQPSPIGSTANEPMRRLAIRPPPVNKVALDYRPIICAADPLLARGAEVYPRVGRRPEFDAPCWGAASQSPTVPGREIVQQPGGSLQRSHRTADLEVTAAPRPRPWSRCYHGFP